ncbi:MAG TPA: hypothetical protein VGI97_08395 [Gemmatimonadaceae bacterium]|jgi:hypothetical protein
MTPKAIYKYALPIADYFLLMPPAGARFLDVQTQGNRPQLWALVDPSAPQTMRHFMLRGTGHNVTAEDEQRFSEYVGTFQLSGGQLVFHLFAEPEIR